MQSGFWRKCRLLVRWSRRAAMVAAVALVCAFVWADRVGVPDFLQRRLVAALRERGVELGISRLRFSLFRGLIAENVRAGQTTAPDSPSLTAAEVRLELNYRAMLHRRLELDGFTLREGKFILPLSPTNALTLDKIQTELRFQENDTWSLDNFKASFAGAKLALSGDIAHAPEIRNWPIFRGAGAGDAAASRAQLQTFSDTLGKIHFTGTPQLSLTVDGDARDVHSFTVHLAITAPGVQTPWAGAREIQFTARLTAPTNNPASVTASSGFWTNLQPFRLAWTARAAEVQSTRADADTVECDGVWSAPELMVTKLTARQGEWTPGLAVQNFDAVATLTAPTNITTHFDPSWSWWTNLQPYRLVWTARLAQLKSDQLNADTISCAGFWSAPELAVTNLSARLGGGGLEDRAWLNVATREFGFTNTSCFDLHAVMALLTDKTRERLAEFSWKELPALRAGGSLILPAWTNRQPDWRAEVQPTIRLLGELAFTNGAAFGAKIDLARAQFAYSNLVWRLPAATVAQSKTRLEISGSEDDATKDYRWHVVGAFDPECLRPFLTTSNAARGLEIVRLAAPAQFEADVRGRLNDYDSIGATGRVALTNFTVRGESMDSVTAAFSYTNRVLEFSSPCLWRGAQTLTADLVTLDFNRMLISFKNGHSTADPAAISRAIGPKTARIVEPYHFLQPPTVFVEGRVPLHDVNGGHDVDDADLRFDIVGGVPFQCLKLRAARVTGTIHWLGQTLILTNIAAELYGGAGNGFANFDFRVPHEGADYQFTAAVTNINLHALAADLASSTNHLEGALSGLVVVTRADTRDWRTMDGYGQAHLRDGLIWDIPMFGILSPVLNLVSPGLGNSRATDAKAKFVITNGVMFSDPLEINTGMTRLDYSGTVDLRGKVNAHVTAQLLHNFPVVGPFISPFLWSVSKLFEYKVTGSLENPNKESVVPFVPGLLEMPFHPIRSLEELIPGGANVTNAPAEK
jgi:hypothetical protein